MKNIGKVGLNNLSKETKISLPQGGHIEKQVVIDKQGNELTVLVIHNGLMTITVMTGRGMEIGDILLVGEKMSWDRSSDYLLHPDHVNLRDHNGITAEMIVNDANSAAGYVIRSLDCFPRSLIAKEINESFMFSFEPCRTRPNRMSQKHIDGEAFFLQPHSTTTTQRIIGVTKNKRLIEALEKSISESE